MAEAPLSLLGLGVGVRLALAGTAAAFLWGVIWWAIGS